MIAAMTTLLNDTKSYRTFATLCSATALCGLLAACPKTPKTGVLEACQQYQRIRECESRILERLPTEINCESLKLKFDKVCQQSDIDYAFKVFKEDADKVCALKTKEDLAKFKPTFDKAKVSKECYQASV